MSKLTNSAAIKYFPHCISAVLIDRFVSSLDFYFCTNGDTTDLSEAVIQENTLASLSMSINGDIAVVTLLFMHDMTNVACILGPLITVGVSPSLCVTEYICMYVCMYIYIYNTSSFSSLFITVKCRHPAQLKVPSFCLIVWTVQFISFLITFKL